MIRVSMKYIISSKTMPSIKCLLMSWYPMNDTLPSKICLRCEDMGRKRENINVVGNIPLKETHLFNVNWSLHGSDNLKCLNHDLRPVHVSQYPKPSVS
jgi:hypothetical protein